MFTVLGHLELLPVASLRRLLIPDRGDAIFMTRARVEVNAKCDVRVQVLVSRRKLLSSFLHVGTHDIS